MIIIILLMRNYTASPRSFHCKAADRLLIRPKGDWTGTFTYSTTAMNYKTLPVGLARLLLHNHEPDFQVFIWAANSQRRLFRTTSGEEREERTLGHSERTGRIAGALDTLLTLEPSVESCRSSSPEEREDCGYSVFSHTFLASAVCVRVDACCRHGNQR